MLQASYRSQRDRKRKSVKASRGREVVVEERTRTTGEECSPRRRWIWTKSARVRPPGNFKPAACADVNERHIIDRRPRAVREGRLAAESCTHGGHSPLNSGQDALRCSRPVPRSPIIYFRRHRANSRSTRAVRHSSHVFDRGLPRNLCSGQAITFCASALRLRLLISPRTVAAEGTALSARTP